MRTTGEENDFFEALGLLEGKKPAVVVRQLLLRGIVDYLKDRSLRIKLSESELDAQLVELMQTDPELRTIKRVIENQRSRQDVDRRASRKKKVG